MNKSKIIGLLVLISMNSMAFEYPVSGIKIIDDPDFLSNQSIESSLANEGYPQYLINIEKEEMDTLNTEYTDPFDTHIKKKRSNIKLTIPFNPEKVIKQENIIGYAPEGSYNHGWNGAIVYFKDDKLGICTFSKRLILAVNLIKQTITYEINGKPTTKYINGNKERGFLYSINWVEENKDKTVWNYVLDCARSNKNDSILDKMLLLGRRIDKA